MPTIKVHTYRGKSDETLRGIVEGVHDALVAEFGMLEDDRFEMIHQYDRNEFFYAAEFRGGPRTDDFVLLEISDRERTDEQKRRFYKAVVTNVSARTGIDDQNVLVILYSLPPVNFSFSGGRSGLEVIATETLNREAKLTGGKRRGYTNDEIIDAILKMFKGDRSDFVALLGDDFVLRMPRSMPYGGEFVGAKAFDDYYGSMTGQHWKSFVTDIDRVIDAGDHLIAPITITAEGRTGKKMSIENLWLFELKGGNVVRAQIYADTAAGVKALDA